MMYTLLDSKYEVLFLACIPLLMPNV
uniref:Uncharacterized protein n=1 Tax=Anguilla anguilla TaxID=7936 RepID=A0A0E9TZU7_ANGAN